MGVHTFANRQLQNHVPVVTGLRLDVTRRRRAHTSADRTTGFPQFEQLPNLDLQSELERLRELLTDSLVIQQTRADQLHAQ